MFLVHYQQKICLQRVFLVPVIIPYPVNLQRIFRTKMLKNPVKVPVLPQPPYSSFDDFNKKISALKLNSYHIQYHPLYTKIFKFDSDHSVPFMEIYVKNNLDFQIRVYLWKIHETHEIYTNSLHNIPLSALINITEKFSVCTGILSTFSNINVVNHIVQKNYDPYMLQDSSLNQHVYYRSRNCAILSTSTICNCCAKCKPKVKIAENRKSVCNSLPANDKAPLSQTSTVCVT